MLKRVYKNCPDCPFKSRTVGARGPVDAPIVIVGESPGTREIIEGIPFIGPSGELLKRLLREVGLSDKSFYITNAIKCLPPRSRDKKGGKIKDGLMNAACKACRSDLMAELTAYPRKLIIAMGSSAARTTIDKWNFSIMQHRGQVVESPLAEHGILPMYHPAYALRNPSVTPQLRSDFRKAEKLISGAPFPKPIVTYRRLNTAAEIDEVIRRDVIEHNSAERNWRVIADIETTGLHRHDDKFRCIGFIAEHKLREYGKNVVYIITGKQQGALVRHLFAKMPAYVEWVWHNGKFDISFLRAKGIPRSQARVDHDTLLLSYTLDETGARHSLEQCIVDHLGLPAYKDRLKEHMKKTGTTFADVDPDHLHQYNAEDVVFTGLLFRKLALLVLGNKRRPQLAQVYSELLVPAANALATVELNGMPIDQDVLLASENELLAKIAPLVAMMRKLAKDRYFNPNSYQQVLKVMKDVYGMKLKSTDEDTLKEFKSHELIAPLLEYRGLQKMLGTYIRAFKKYGSRVHTSYLIHGTVTGRLASSSPNMQNIPKEAIVRRHFKTTSGRVFVSFDYSQAELRSLAVLSGDEALIRIFASGLDMHTAVAGLVFGERFTREPEFLPNDDPDIEIENPVFNKYRRYAKTINFGVVYGVTAPTLAERLGILVSEAQELIDSWFRRFPRAREFMDKCRAAPVEGRPLITVFGRQRRFYVVARSNLRGQENEAGNFPHQSMCSDFTLAAAIEIDKIAGSRGLPGNAVQVNIIHDDNMFEIDDDNASILKLISVVRPIMEGVPRKYGITSLLFKVDVKQGNVWSQMQKIKGA